MIMSNALQVPAIKIAQLLKAGCEVVILLADIHAFLDSLKAPLELVENRVKFYKKVITALLKAAGAPIEKLEFVTGSSYQKSPEYVMDLYKLASLTVLLLFSPFKISMSNKS